MAASGADVQARHTWSTLEWEPGKQQQQQTLNKTKPHAQAQTVTKTNKTDQSGARARNPAGFLFRQGQRPPALPILFFFVHSLSFSTYDGNPPLFFSKQFVLVFDSSKRTASSLRSRNLNFNLDESNIICVSVTDLSVRKQTYAREKTMRRSEIKGREREESVTDRKEKKGQKNMKSAARRGGQASQTARKQMK